MKRCLALLAVSVLLIGAAACSFSPPAGAVDYTDPAAWAVFETENADARADVFFVCPTVFFGDERTNNMPLTDEDAKADFLGAIRMEQGIYDEGTRFFAPYYRQAALNVYEMDAQEREVYLEAAFADVRDAFAAYLENYNDGRPVILAGFSQGADMCLRLMKSCFTDETLMEQLIACYAIGWHLTEEEIRQYPQLVPAQGEEDTGVIITFNSEAESIDDSLIVPRGTKTLSVNPLIWRTDTQPADRSENLGACFTDYSGAVTEEIDQFTGAYIDPVRGTLKVPDVMPEEYPAGLPIFEDGIYHLYDYQFFYRNLQKNVQTRIAAYLAEQGETQTDADRAA